MHYLKRVQQSRRRRPADRQQSRLLLLRAIRNIRIERYRQQGMVVENAARRTDHRFAVAANVPSGTQARCPVIFVARKSLRNI